MTFSIIIPAYNSAKTISETLNSILNQTYQDFEVLVMDGNSSDNTIEIVKKHQTNSSKLDFVSEKDNGVYDAMNKGIKLAKGDYLYFMGSDDVFLDFSTLQNVFNAISGEDIVYGNVKFKHSGKIHSGKSSLDKLLYDGVSICHQALFYKKSVFETIGDYNEKYFIHADHEFNIRCFEYDNFKIKYINQVIAIFNEQGLSGIETNSDGYFQDLTRKKLENLDYFYKIKKERDFYKSMYFYFLNSWSFKLGRFLLSPFVFFRNLFSKKE